MQKTHWAVSCRPCSQFLKLLSIGWLVWVHQNAAVESGKPVVRLFETVVVLRHDISRGTCCLRLANDPREADSLVPSRF